MHNLGSDPKLCVSLTGRVEGLCVAGQHLPRSSCSCSRSAPRASPSIARLPAPTPTSASRCRSRWNRRSPSFRFLRFPWHSTRGEGQGHRLRSARTHHKPRLRALRARTRAARAVSPSAPRHGLSRAGGAGRMCGVPTLGSWASRSTARTMQAARSRAETAKSRAASSGARRLGSRPRCARFSHGPSMSAWYPRTGVPNLGVPLFPERLRAPRPAVLGEGGGDGRAAACARRTRKALRRPQRATLGRRI
jgi:hypothetical protein